MLAADLGPFSLFICRVAGGVNGILRVGGESIERLDFKFRFFNEKNFAVYMNSTNSLRGCW